MGQTHQQEAAIFEAAMDLPPEQRAAHLDKACGSNAALRQRMESLLKAEGSSGGFLDSPADPVAGERTRVLPASLEKAGDRIGHYRLVQQIGEGGCGVVYMAEQLEPVRRRVALKIIKLGMDTESVIARFEAERQALAMMDHPNIAKVFDAGVAETGRPYFVMELVRGLKITNYCDEAKLSTPARLDLFIQVCQAVQHAHQKGIIHRDIKPSNILVTVNEGGPIPKVIDFGIAKATSGQRLTDKTIFTAFEQFVGTPAYMSPEQANMTSLDIDTRSDIYALGVLLYELLTGKTPFDAEKLLAIGFDEMRRTICEQEPPRPSTRLSALPDQELSTTAHRRGLQPLKLLSDLRGDLDWIVMKALEKERARRYETANGLAVDIKRHLKNEPVVACPPSRAYRFRKMLRRHMLVSAAVAAVVTALIVGFGTSTWMFFKERKARTRAVAAEEAERILRQEAELRELSMRALQISVQPGAPDAIFSSRKEALQAQRRLLGNEHPDVADSLEELARLFLKIKNFPEAEKAAREALAIRRRISPEGDLKVARSLLRFSYIFSNQDKFSEAEELLVESLRIQRSVQGDSVDTAITMTELAVVLERQNKVLEAVALYRQAFEIARKLLPDGDAFLAVAGHNLIQELIDVRRLSEAAVIVRDFVPRNELQMPGLIKEVSGLARQLYYQGRAHEAEQMLHDLVAKAPGNRTILRARAEYWARCGRWKEAAADFFQLTHLQPEEQEQVYGQDRHELAALLVQSRDLPRYRQLCQWAVKQFGNTRDITTAHLISKDCLIHPDSGVDLSVVDRMAELCVAGGITWGAHASTKALAAHRQGRFPAAADLAEKVLAADRRPGWLAVQTSAILAMARHGCGQSELAQATLGGAQAMANHHLPTLESPDLGEEFVEVVISYALLREAEALIRANPESTVQMK